MLQVFQGPITGRKFFSIISLFFVVIVSVNLVLAYSAIKTFPGLEVKNSYVASQTFDAERSAQLALGWSIDARVQNGELLLSITDSGGAAVEAATITGTFGRATNVQDDQTPEFVFDGAMYRAPVKTAPGNWNLRMVATAADGTRFQQRVVVIIED